MSPLTFQSLEAHIIFQAYWNVGDWLVKRYPKPTILWPLSGDAATAKTLVYANFVNALVLDIRVGKNKKDFRYRRHNLWAISSTYAESATPKEEDFDMESVWQLVLFGGLLFLMMRFGCGSHMFGHGQEKGHEHGRPDHPAQGRHRAASSAGSDLRWSAPEKDTDPVCGETVSTDKARPSLHDGQVYYFCSRECREAFEAAPDHYVGQGARRELPRLPHTSAKGGSHG